MEDNIRLHDWDPHTQLTLLSTDHAEGKTAWRILRFANVSQRCSRYVCRRAQTFAGEYSFPLQNAVDVRSQQTDLHRSLHSLTSLLRAFVTRKTDFREVA